MRDGDKVFSGSIPEVYDTYLVPLIFESYARDLAGRAASLSPLSVLETAAGSGVLTRALAPQLQGDAEYIASDLNQPMLDRAASRQGADDRISWQQADALRLPFDDAAFDAVCCQFGVMFFPDRVAGYTEARRVLKSGGRLLFNVWDRIEENVFARDVLDAVATLFPGDPPQFLARTPYGYSDVDLIREEVTVAGFKDVTITPVEDESRAPSPRHPAVAFCQGTPLRNEIEERDENALDAATDRASEAIATRHGAGPVSAKIRAYVIVAKA